MVVLAVHAVWIALYFAAGHEVRDFIKIGRTYVTRSHVSSVIRFDPHYAYPQNHQAGSAGSGYDGQFSYYIALDPSKARYYIDAPSYRYQRILYPMLARFTALERASAVPWTMLILNWLAVAGGVVALGAWLARKGISCWFALIYGLFPGMFIALQRDLTEPLAYGLVALAIYLFDFGGRRGLLWSGLAFGLAALARETTLVFALLFGVSIILGRPNATGSMAERRSRIVSAAAFGLLALGPVLVWTVALWSWLGAASGQATNLAPPFAGAFQVPFRAVRQPVDILFAALPAMLVAAVAVRRLRLGAGRTELLCLLVNVGLLIVLASGKVWDTYTSMGRQSIAIVLAALICLPYLSPRLEPGLRSVRALISARRPTYLLLVASACLWLVMIPVVVYYGFSSVRV